ncbi:hypothetical protein GCM10022212_36880 [Actimicrobium antarcticum]|uniref:Secreted protein n=1 Tax=Actimicrobium antarcticum TaxID=1051899 RepID=A0ABP7U1G6_9BURK
MKMVGWLMDLLPCCAHQKEVTEGNVKIRALPDRRKARTETVVYRHRFYTRWANAIVLRHLKRISRHQKKE